MSDRYTQQLSNGDGEALNILNSLIAVQKSYEQRYPQHELNKYDPIIILYLYGLNNDKIKKIYSKICGNNSNTMTLFLKACELNPNIKSQLFSYLNTDNDKILNIDLAINEIIEKYETNKQLIFG